MWLIKAFFSTASRALLIFMLGGGILGNALVAKEPTNWIFGFGVGAGKSQIEQKWSDSIVNGVEKDKWTSYYVQHSNVVDWGVTWEFLAGYKHWLNDWVGFRYYANVGAQHYKNDIFTAGKVKAGIIEYTANADLLLNFYDSEFFTFGIFGGFGIGGAYFDSPALKTYEQRWGPTNENPQWFADRDSYAGMGKTKKHHLSASLSAGARFNIFQKIRHSSERSCSEVIDGRRTCRVPISYLEHSIEFSAKFPMLTYYPTKYSELVGVATTTHNPNTYTGVYPRPAYEVKNPYKFTLRYIVAF